MPRVEPELMHSHQWDRLGHPGGGGFDGGGMISTKASLSLSPTLRKGINILFSRSQEIQKAHAKV
jgi:hypothetical protein